MKVQTIALDYPVNPQPRYGHGKPPHEGLYRILAAHRERYARSLRSFRELKDDLVRIPAEADGADALSPHWLNGYLPGMDAASLYGFLALGDPKRYLEIGSGNSTRFA